MEETINLQGCPKHYLEPDIVELSFDPVRQSCSDVYSSADLLLSTTCRRLNESQNCFLNLNDSLHNNPECFRINELVVEYSCEGNFLELIFSKLYVSFHVCGDINWYIIFFKPFFVYDFSFFLHKHFNKEYVRKKQKLTPNRPF